MRNFNEIYDVIHEKYAMQMEDMRRGFLDKLLIVSIVAILIGLILSAITTQPVFLILTVVTIALYIALSKNKKEYMIFFKNNVVSTFVKEYNDTLKYSPTRGISPQIYREGEFESYDRFYTEDLITGTLDDKYNITMAEVHTEVESTDSDGHTTYSTVFWGLFAKIELEKLIPTTMKVRRNTLISLNKKEKVEMDSGEFEKKFNVYSKDKIIAMQLLTSDIMQMLLDFTEQNKIMTELTLKGSYLYIRFSTGNMFEPKILKNSFDYDTLKKYFDTINFTLDITEKFLKNVSQTEI